MTDYTPTTDEVETAFHEFASELETKSPGEYEYAPEFADWREALKGFRRWLEAHDREVAASERRAAMLEVLDLLSARGGWGDYLGRDGSRQYGFALRPPISGAATGLFDWLREQADQIEAGDSND